MEDGMKHRILGKEVEQPYIIIFLTYGGASRRGGPRLPTVRGPSETNSCNALEGRVGVRTEG